ncbi:molybdate ABC transporter substrate-binding protein [Demetria terragena]|uniref:molybdate ABC transporter substrate-binding protein n=1 Tax=Demetria terragena TaxID=63959 RepID=UPI0003629C95|nr:molybdate ABC transporter substrate-binding protein [Demetria terragena]
MKRMKCFAAASVTAIALAGCGGSENEPSTESSAAPDSAAAISGKITVFAAASLKESFTTLEKDFEKSNPDADIVFSFGPSSGLATQITQGAPADVFASAAPKNMEQVTSGGDAKGPKTFATNQMAIVTPPDNPGKITSLSDLAKADVKTAICQPQVPCGGVAAEVFKKSKVRVKPATEEVDVKAVLTKVQLGEVDAGMVYVTDSKAARSKVKTIDLTKSQNASTQYPIVQLTKAPNAAGAKAFIDLVLSDKGQQVLAKAGFSAPS